MKQYDAFLFDWDGCLARTLPVWMGVFREITAEYGKHPTDAQIAAHLGDWNMPRDLGIDDAHEFFDKSVALAQPRLLQVELYDGAADLLRALKADGRKLALLSSAPRPLLEIGLEHNGIVDVFDIVLAAEDVANHKPHPEIIEKGLVALGAHADRSVMIGDSDKDLGAAASAGVDSILFHTPEHELLYDSADLRALKPTFIVASFKELRQLIIA